MWDRPCEGTMASAGRLVGAEPGNEGADGKWPVGSGEYKAALRGTNAHDEEVDLDLVYIYVRIISWK